MDPTATAANSRDMMPLAPSGQPLAVVLPTCTAEVVSIMQICAAHGVPIVPRVAGPVPAALLIGQSDAGGAAGRRRWMRWRRSAWRRGPTFAHVSDDLAESRMLLQARRDVLPLLESLAIWATDDVSVPRTAIAALISACARILRRRRLTIGMVGHAGDSNTHPTIVHDGADPAQVAAAELTFGLMLDAGHALGGTVTGEQGVGRIKQGFLAAEIGQIGVHVHRRIRAALDPQGLSNPGSMFTPA